MMPVKYFLISIFHLKYIYILYRFFICIRNRIVLKWFSFVFPNMGRQYNAHLSSSDLWKNLDQRHYVGGKTSPN